MSPGQTLKKISPQCVVTLRKLMLDKSKAIIYTCLLDKAWKSWWNVCELPGYSWRSRVSYWRNGWENNTALCTPSPWPNILLSESLLIPQKSRENRWPDSKLNREKGSEWKTDKWENEGRRRDLLCRVLSFSFPFTSCHSRDKVATWDYWEQDKLQPRSQRASTVCAPDTSPSATVLNSGSLSRQEKKKKLSVFYERRAIWNIL